ncbi:MAG: 2-oxoacid:acceptor oxidoreductase family protein [Planctomycetota bacterium]|nr:2-oxoacid:acceptor oxidoreductase family protein [Planctomycetota bacterium]
MAHAEIRLSGFGGQGIILAGQIVGKAVSVFEDRNATLTQNYGPESRGGACCAQVVMSDEEIAYPDIVEPDVFVAMSQEAYNKYYEDVKPNGLSIIDEDLVVPKAVKSGGRLLKMPATRLADGMGKKFVANIVMLGFLAAVSDTVSTDALKEAVKSSVPKGTEELNMKAFQLGYDHGKRLPAATPAGKE